MKIRWISIATFSSDRVIQVPRYSLPIMISQVPGKIIKLLASSLRKLTSAYFLIIAEWGRMRTPFANGLIRLEVDMRMAFSRRTRSWPLLGTDATEKFSFRDPKYFVEREGILLPGGETCL